MTENDYNQAVNDLFAAIETLLENTDCDFDYKDQVMEIMTDEEETIVINKQSAKQEVWLASQKGGGHHFVYVNSQWRDTRDSSLLLDQLQRLLR